MFLILIANPVMRLSHFLPDKMNSPIRKIVATGSIQPKLLFSFSMHYAFFLICLRLNLIFSANFLKFQIDKLDVRCRKSKSLMTINQIQANSQYMHSFCYDMFMCFGIRDFNIHCYAMSKKRQKYNQFYDSSKSQ